LAPPPIDAGGEEDDVTSCSHRLPFARVLERVVGIEYVGSRGVGIRWLCRCGKPVTTPWNEAREPMKARGKQVELENMRLAGAV